MKHTTSAVIFIAISIVSLELLVRFSQPVLSRNESRSDKQPRAMKHDGEKPDSIEASDSADSNQSARTPDALVRQFYSWYLGELRDGKEPYKQEKKMKQYVSDGFIQEHSSGPKDFDLALGLPKPESGWYNMKVEIGKPKYYHKKPLYDAYVDVTYKGFTDRGASNRGGTSFVTIENEWSIGLQRTGASWRIASIGIKD